MAGILDGIHERFPPKRRRETPLRDDPMPPPGDAPIRYIVYRFEELRNTLVVVVFDGEAKAEVKRRFDGHALWFANELIALIRPYATWCDEANTLVMRSSTNARIADLARLFLATCHTKAFLQTTLIPCPQSPASTSEVT